VYSDRRIPEYLQRDKTLWGECLSGALYYEDFRRMMAEVGFIDFRVVKKSRVTVENKDIELILGDIKFYSITVRAFKLTDLEDKCEDFGQTATYKGAIRDFSKEFKLDSGHKFPKN
jgi:arsenite methyltransferase